MLLNHIGKLDLQLIAKSSRNANIHTHMDVHQSLSLSIYIYLYIYIYIYMHTVYPQHLLAQGGTQEMSSVVLQRPTLKVCFCYVRDFCCRVTAFSLVCYDRIHTVTKWSSNNTSAICCTAAGRTTSNHRPEWNSYRTSAIRCVVAARAISNHGEHRIER